MDLLNRASLRFLWHHRTQALLAVCGIAMGVAVVIGIQTIQSAARDSFSQSITQFEGIATHKVSAVGRELLTSDLAALRRHLHAWQPAPVIQATVMPLSGVKPERYAQGLQLIAIDPLSYRSNNRYADFDAAELLSQTHAVVLNDRTATALGLQPGQSFVISLNGAELEVELVSVVPGRDASLADWVVLCDLASLSELGENKTFSSIELTAPPGIDADIVLQQLRQENVLPPALLIASRQRQQQQASQLTAAFFTNLDALSLLAILVGGFMIYNTMAFLVTQRRRLIARLRALGVSANAIVWQVLAEAWTLASLGALIGIVLAYVLADSLLPFVAVTLGDHYDGAALEISRVHIGLAVKGWLLAVLTATVASALPARQAANENPASATHMQVQPAEDARQLAAAARWGLLAGLAAALILTFSGRSLYAGFTALGLMLLAASLMLPEVLRRLLGLGVRCAHIFPTAERIALNSAAAAIGRIGMAVAALMAATATTIGIAIMVASFRLAVIDWIDQLLRADIYLSQQAAPEDKALFSPAVMQQLLNNPRINTISKIHRTRGQYKGRSVNVTAYALPPAARSGFSFLNEVTTTDWQAFESSRTVFVSEPFAWHFALEPGDEIALTTPTGSHRWRIAGIYSDYGSEQGVIAVSWANLQQHWQQTHAHGLGIYAAPAVNLDELQQSLTAQYADAGTVTVWSKQEIEAQSLLVFDRTFVITDLLTYFAALIAALGLLNALLALNLERMREFAVMRALGCSALFIRRSLYGEAAVVAIVAMASAIPVGIVIAYTLTAVINQRSFGWSMPFTVSTAELVLPVCLCFVATLLACVLPAERAVRIDPARTLRDE